MEDYFQQSIPGFDIRIEKGTESVPKDGKYHIVMRRKVAYSTKNLKIAQTKFYDLLSQLGYTPKPAKKLTTEEIKRMLNNQRFDKFSQSYDDYWNNSYKFRKGGILNKR